MSLSALPPPLLAAIINHGQLELSDIAALRLVSRAWNDAFTAGELCVFLLRHFFPFAQETHDATMGVVALGQSEQEAFNAVCRRLQRVREGKWSLNWEVTFPAAAQVDGAEDMFPPEGFRLVDTDSDEGYFLTAFVEEDHAESTRIMVRNLVTGQDVTVSVPREDLAGIYMSGGKVLLVYNRVQVAGSSGGGSMFILADCRSGGSGRTLWSASVNSSVFQGLASGHTASGKKRLQPVFNEHYIAFLNALDSSGHSNILILRFHPSSSGKTSESTELHICPLRISPSTLISFSPDTSGVHLLVAECFPHHKNLHRVVLINALSGANKCAFHFNVSPQFSLVPSRDMQASISPSGNEIILWGSVRSSEYRNGGILGQLMVFPISGGSSTLVRYLGTPSRFGKEPSSVGPPAQTRYNPSLNIVSYANIAVGFPSLNLDLPAAGTGGLLNPFNFRPALWSSTPAACPQATAELGKSWIVTERTSLNNRDITVELMRIADPKPFAPSQPYTDSGSKRSSWILGSTAPGSSSASVFGHPVSGAPIAQVDAEELAQRLKEMERERAKEAGVKKRSWEETKRTWKEKLFSAWR